MEVPTVSKSSSVAPTTSAIRSSGTSVQLRQTKACSLSGKWAKFRASGAGPWGNATEATREMSSAEIMFFLLDKILLTCVDYFF